MGISLRASKRDVLWNYAGTIISMGSSFLLLPILLVFLNDNELGLWYVFLAISSLTNLFEFGFNPTFARNIVYVIGGARELSSFECVRQSIDDGVDWHLLRTVMKTCKFIYSSIAMIALFLVTVPGTIYIHGISGSIPGEIVWPAWVVFCISIFLNLYFLYWNTFLRGAGDVAGENRAITIAKIAQLVVSYILVSWGWGLLGASLGYLAYGLLLRFIAARSFLTHSQLVNGLEGDSSKIDLSEMVEIVKSISGIAWRDGVVQLAAYFSTQATTMVCSATLTLAQTGTYSVLMQFANAIASVSSAYARSYYPTFQSAFVENNIDVERDVVSKSTAVYWIFMVLGTIFCCLVVLPILPLFKPDVHVDIYLFALLSIYLGLWQQHSMFCNFIVGMNQIPYLFAYVAASVAGLLISIVLIKVFSLGAYGLVLGQAISQAVFNNFRWPRWVARKLGVGYFYFLANGFNKIKAKLF